MKKFWTLGMLACAALLGLGGRAANAQWIGVGTLEANRTATCPISEAAVPPGSSDGDSKSGDPLTYRRQFLWDNPNTTPYGIWLEYEVKFTGALTANAGLGAAGSGARAFSDGWCDVQGPGELYGTLAPDREAFASTPTPLDDQVPINKTGFDHIWHDPPAGGLEEFFSHPVTAMVSGSASAQRMGDASASAKSGENKAVITITIIAGPGG